MRVARGPRTALATLTVLPMGRFAPEPAAAVPWYPWVGWLFGVLALGVASASWELAPEGPLGALGVGVAVVVLWAGFSRLLHWDGLADTADGLLGGATPARRLEIMRDSATGAFGTTAVVLVALAQVVGVALVYESGSWWALGVAPVLARAVAALGAATVRPARADGLGTAAHAGGVRWPGALVLLLGLAPALVGWPADPMLSILRVAAVAALLAVGYMLTRAIARPIGGQTGDVLGASVLLTETVVLAVAAVLGGIAL